MSKVGLPLWSCIWIVLSIWSGSASAAARIQYGGRLSNGNGAPLSGVVTLSASFHSAPSGGTTLGATGPVPGVTLTDGVFQMELPLEPAELHAIFANPESEVWIEIKDVTNNRTYPRQRFGLVPYALKIPVDGVTIGYDDDGRLTLPVVTSGQAGEVLTSDGDGGLVWAAPGGIGALTTDSVTEGSNNQYFTAARAQTALAGALAGKEPVLASGSTAQYLRGDKSWQTLDTAAVAESTNQYFTGDRARAAAVADSLTDGVTTVAPSQNAVFDALATKEPAIAGGTTLQYLRGDKTWQTLDTSVVQENGNQYFTISRARSAAVANTISDGVTTVAPSQKAVFDALAQKQDVSQRNVANGYAGLDASGKIDVANLPYSGLSYQGTWNAAMNLPALTSSACGTSGDYYIVDVGGSTTLDGVSTWNTGDWVLCATTNEWQRVGNTSSGITINGYTGSTFVLDTDDIAEGGKLYFTAARAKEAAVEDSLSDGVSDVAPSQNAVFDALAVKANSTHTHGNADLVAGIDAAKIGSGTVSNTEFGYLSDVTSSIQTQLDGKASSSHTHGNADLVAGIDAAKIGAGGVSNAEFGYLAGVTSAIQTQLNAKASSNHNHSSLDGASGGVLAALSVANNGDVGIGTSVPTAKLEVAGQVKITGGSPGAGKVLTSDANGLATWESPDSSNSMVLLGTFTASSSSEIVITGLSSTYRTYVIELIHLVPTSDAVDLLMRVSTDGGTTFLSAAGTYTWNVLTDRPGGTPVDDGVANAAQIQLNNSGYASHRLGNAAGESLSGRITLFDPAGSRWTTMTTQHVLIGSTGELITISGAAAYKGTTAVNALRLYLSSGTIASGTVRVYGIKN